MACYDYTDAVEAATQNVAQPGLLRLLQYLNEQWPGGMLLGIHFDRPIRGGTQPSVHSAGRALDWRYADANGAPLIVGGRPTIDMAVLPFLVDNADKLGIQGIGDYYDSDGNGRFWKRCRAADGSGRGWKLMPPSNEGWGQAWARWLHVEMDKAAAADDRTILERLGAYQPPVQEVHHLTGMQTVGLGRANEGNHVVVLQGLLNIRIGAGLGVDGKFGNQTDAAVRKYQQITMLTVDGVVGPSTWERLGY